MKIFIRNLIGRSIQIIVNGSDTIATGKLKYQKTLKINNNIDLQWKIDGKVLNNNKTFDDYLIEEDDNITSNDRSEGGK